LRELQKGIVLGRVISVILCLAILSEKLYADIVQIGFSGKITDVTSDESLFEGNVCIGDSFDGTYVYDSDGSDCWAVDEHNGKYCFRTEPYGISVNVGQFVIGSDPGKPEFCIKVRNDVDALKHDSFWITSENNIHNLPLGDRIELTYISWGMKDYSCTAISSDSLLKGPPNLSDWQIFPMYVDGQIDGGCNGLILAAQVTDVWLIPEPATLALLGFGGLAALRRRRRL